MSSTVDIDLSAKLHIMAPRDCPPRGQLSYFKAVQWSADGTSRPRPVDRLVDRPTVRSSANALLLGAPAQAVQSEVGGTTNAVGTPLPASLVNSSQM